MIRIKCAACGNDVFTEEMPLGRVLQLEGDGTYICGYCGAALGLKK
jgi:DNA-directed RNA polymerase subunit RPC12/RpoP